MRSKYDASGDDVARWTAVKNDASKTPFMPPPSKESILNTVCPRPTKRGVHIISEEKSLNNSRICSQTA
jgi:hypothetical protein